MTIYLNDARLSFPEGCSLQELLDAGHRPEEPFALAVNTVFVPRSRYSQTQLREGDRIDIVIASQGG